MKKIILVLFYTFLVITASYFRESVFSSMPGVTTYTSYLVIQKALLSILFLSVFLLLTIGIVHALFNRRLFIWIAAAVYIGIGLISVLAFTIGIAVNEPETGYRIAHAVFLFTQSPVLIMMIVPAFLLYKG